MHASENKQFNDHCMELKILIVRILHFIILNNLSGREFYWYCLVHMIKFIAERPNDGKREATTGACQCSIDPFKQVTEITMSHNFPLILNNSLITVGKLKIQLKQPRA